MGVGARSVALIMAGTLAAGMTACPNRKAPRETSILGTDQGNLSLVKPDHGVVDPPLLQRPLRLPQLGAGQPCPITKGTTQQGAYELGSGPVRLILDAARDPRGVFHYGSSSLYNRFRLLAARWIVEPSARGAIFLHGERLDANQGIWFLPTVGSRNMYRATAVGQLPVIEIFRWLLLPSQNAGSRARALDGGTATRGPGCFGIQADGAGFSSVIVFRLER